MENKIWLVVTPGDPAGIGPEIFARILREEKYPQDVSLLVIGARAPLENQKVSIRAVAPVDLPSLLSRPSSDRKTAYLIAAPEKAPARRFLPGYQSGWSIECATGLVKKNAVAALVTGPISKERLQKGGYPYPGHTEFLAKLCKVKPVTMMLANPDLRVTLVTTHLPIKSLSRALTRERVRKTLNHTVEALRAYWGISCPRVAVTGFNPHAGEGGIFGDEEKRVILPEVRAAQKRWGAQVQIEGPIPADTLFAVNQMREKHARYDAVVCMYHDQALIPVKLLDFPHTVNVTLGLPIIRTSVDHGTGFDIVGTGQADPSSLQSAIELAAVLVRASKKV